MSKYNLYFIFLFFLNYNKYTSNKISQNTTKQNKNKMYIIDFKDGGRVLIQLLKIADFRPVFPFLKIEEDQLRFEGIC